MKRPMSIALLVLFALIAAACGGDDDDDSSAEPTAESSEEAATDDAPADDAAADDSADDDAADDAAGDDASGDDSTDEAAAEDASDDAAATGDSGPADDSLEPVRIGLLNQENDVVGSFPEYRIGTEGAVAYVNAELGGIGGHPVELVTCVQGGVEPAQECAQQLATDDLVSLINGVNIWTFAFDFYGTMGETPVIGGLPLFPSDYNQANARYFNGGSISVYSAMARFAAEELGAQKVSVLVNSNPAADAAVAQGLVPIFEQFGVEYTTIDVPLPLTDAVPPVSQAAADESDIVMLLAAQNECIPVATAANQLGIPPEKMLYSATCAAAEVYAEVGELIVGSWMARGGFVPEDPWAPQEVKDLLDEFDVLVETYAPEAPDAAFTGLAWATFLDLHDLYEEVGVENLSDPANIFAVSDDGQTRGRIGGYGWACVYADIGLQSVCQGDNLFVQIVDADGNSAPPPNDGAFVNGLELLPAQ